MLISGAALRGSEDGAGVVDEPVSVGPFVGEVGTATDVEVGGVVVVAGAAGGDDTEPPRDIAITMPRRSPMVNTRVKIVVARMIGPERRLRLWFAPSRGIGGYIIRVVASYGPSSTPGRSLRPDRCDSIFPEPRLSTSTSSDIRNTRFSSPPRPRIPEPWPPNSLVSFVATVHPHLGSPE